MSVSLSSVIAAAVEDMESSGRNSEYIEAAIYEIQFDITRYMTCNKQRYEPHKDRIPANEKQRDFTI